LDQNWAGDKNSYAAFFFATLNFAKVTAAPAAIFLWAEADIV
jgi:hypothetical protein